MLVEPGQPEHVVHQHPHPLGFQGDPAHRLIDLAALGQRPLLVEFGAALLIGALAGLLPALKAARLSPTEALWTL
jgi:hypothetical protein